MRNKRLRSMEEDIFDTFGELDTELTDCDCDAQEKITPIHSDNWTIVDAFNTINENLGHSQLKEKLFIRCAEAFNFLSEKMGLSPVQCVVIAMLAESGRALSYRNMGNNLGLSRLSMMTHYNEIEELFKKRWVLHSGQTEADGVCDAYVLVNGVVSAIRENRPFIPEDLKCNDTQEFIERLALHIGNFHYDEDDSFDDNKLWIEELVNTNKDLPICKLALGLNDVNSMSLLMLVIADYCNYCGTEEEGIRPGDVQLIYPRDKTPNYNVLVNMMKRGTHQLFREKLIEHKNENGMANVNCYVATSHLKNDILDDFTPHDNSSKRIPRLNNRKSYKDITPKTLFYNKSEGEQVERLKNIISREQFPLVQERLKEKGMRTGVCILLHGAPGTGKTATAYELARLTGRDIIQVQVTDFMDKYVGESENKLKAIFNKYRECCKISEVSPILLLNEGDAILSKRTTNIEKSVDQMSNALQNILLEEMENLEGIMIVTTNLTINLDKAFERRFIFKIQFDKPCNEAKAHIWKSMIDTLNDEDSMALAELYDISGGEIENIARKTTMEYVLTGKQPDLDMVKEFAKDEKLNTKTRPVIGFNTNNK